jgi:hypothetical protein
MSKDKDVYIYSTLSNDQLYTNYTAVADSPNKLPIKGSTILVKGKANILDKRFFTPQGVVTKVSAEDLSELRRNKVFNLHVANGFITVSEAKADPDIVAADMTGRDKSAPDTAESLLAEGKEEKDLPVENRKQK